MRGAVIVLLAAVIAGPAGAAGFSSVRVEGHGTRVVCHGAVTRILDASGKFDEAVLSPDKHTVAFTRWQPSKDVPGPHGGDDGEAGALWIGDCRTGKAHESLPAEVRPDAKGNGWISLDGPVFALDGRTVYVTAIYGGDGGLVQRVDVASGHYGLAFPGEFMGIIASGPYAGDMLATQHTSVEDGHGGAYAIYPIYVLRPDGKEVLRIHGSEKWSEADTKRWLRKRGWRVGWPGQVS